MLSSDGTPWRSAATTTTITTAAATVIAPSNNVQGSSSLLTRRAVYHEQSTPLEQDDIIFESMASFSSWRHNISAGRMGWLQSILPSFISPMIWPELYKARRIHPTSYLDGLRGLASVIVFICHYTEDNHHYFTPTYGLNTDNVSSWIQLPFLRIIYSGRPMVHIFFVISGFVLSTKPLKAIASRDFDKCYDALSSSAFRRPFRLFGPCIVSTFLIAIMIQIGWLFQPLPSLWVQLALWGDAVLHSITWPWSWDQDLRPGYDVHLWSIPIEFVHSMLLFMVILMLAKIRPRIRQTAVVGLLAYCMACGKWAAFEFLAGMLLSEIYVNRSVATTQYESITDASPRPERLITNSATHYGIHGVLFFAAIFVGCWPNQDADKTPGIEMLLTYTPISFPPLDDLTPQKFWFALQAVVMVWCCGEVAFAREFLEGPFAQYCGDISYAIYIVHGPVLNILQTALAGTAYTSAKGLPGDKGYRPEISDAGVKGWIGIETAFQRNVVWLIGLSLLAPIVVWVADLFWRFVDVPVVHAARRLEAVCLDTSANSHVPSQDDVDQRRSPRQHTRQQSRHTEMASLA